MECRDVREQLSAYIDEVLDPTEKNLIEKHLADCALCRQELADLRQTIEIVKALGEVAPPELFHEQLKEKLLKEATESAGFVHRLKNRALFLSKRLSRQKWMAVAAVLILGLGVTAIAGKALAPVGLHSYGGSPRETSQAQLNREAKDKADFNMAQSDGSTRAEDTYRYKSDEASTEKDADSAEQNSSEKRQQDTVREEAVLGFGAAREAEAPYSSKVMEGAREPEEAGNQRALVEKDSQDRVEKAPAETTASEAAVSSAAVRGDTTDTADATDSADNRGSGGDGDTEARQGTGDSETTEEVKTAPKIMAFGAQSAGETTTKSGAATNVNPPSVGDKVALGDTEKGEMPKTGDTEEVRAAEEKNKTVTVADSSAREGENPENSEKKVQKETGDAEEQIAKNGRLTVEVNNFDETASKINTIATRFGGYVENSRQQVSGQRGSFVVRVPIDQFPAALAEFEKLGKATEMATIELEVREVKDKNTPGAEGVFKRIWNAFKDSCNDLFKLVETVIVSLGRALPFLGLIALAVVGYKLYKKQC